MGRSLVIRAVVVMMHGRGDDGGVAVGFREGGRGGRGDGPALAALGGVVILVGVVVGVAFVVAGIDVVEDDAGGGATDLRDGVLDALQHVAREAPVLDHDDHHV